jgi:hypothetical protein
MDMSKYMGTVFVKYDDVAAAPLRKKITAFGIGRKYDKPQITFSDGTTLSLNVTNTTMLGVTYGKDGRSWVGHVVELFGGKTRFEGREQNSVLLRPISAARPQDLPPAEPDNDTPPRQGRDDMDDEIPF